MPADELARGLWDDGGDGSVAGRLPGGGTGGGGGEAKAVSQRGARTARGAGMGGQSALQGGPAAVGDAGDAAAVAADAGVYLDLVAEGRGGGAIGWLPDGRFVWDGSSGDRDLAETAALVATLDLVITTDTCIAHLAGAMGKPVWILLPHLADWRWMQETGDDALVSDGAAAAAEDAGGLGWAGGAGDLQSCVSSAAMTKIGLDKDKYRVRSFRGFWHKEREHAKKNPEKVIDFVYSML